MDPYRRIYEPQYVQRSTSFARSAPAHRYASKPRDYVVVKKVVRSSPADTFEEMVEEKHRSPQSRRGLQQARSMGDLRREDAFPSRYDAFPPNASKLHQWSTWRTDVNQSLAGDLLTDHHHSNRRSPKVYPHQDTSEHRTRERRTRESVAEITRDNRGAGRDGVMRRYGTASDHGTALRFTEYLNYGIPRASVRDGASMERGGRGVLSAVNGDSGQYQRGREGMSFTTESSEDDTAYEAYEQRRKDDAQYQSRSAYTIYKLEEQDTKRGVNRAARAIRRITPQDVRHDTRSRPHHH